MQIEVQGRWGRLIDTCVYWGLLLVIGMQIGTTLPKLSDTLYPGLYAACISAFIVRRLQNARWFKGDHVHQVFGTMSLDRVGDLLNIKRHVGEPDDAYRRRINKQITSR